MEDRNSLGPQSLPKSQSRFPVFSRRDLMRAALLASAASVLGPGFGLAQSVASAPTPAARGEEGSSVLSAANWKPVFLTVPQDETLVALSELIIPATETPGAKEALVNRFLDLLLSIESPAFQARFVDALSYIDGESQRQLGQQFRTLTPSDRIWLLTPWAYPRQPDAWIEQEEAPDPGLEHFARLKALIADAYYGSEIGHHELGWDSEITHGAYQGCEQPAANHY